MAGSGFSVGTASVRVVPSFSGFRESVQSEVGTSLEGAASTAEESGRGAGEKYQGGVKDSLKGLGEAIGGAFAVEKVVDFFKESLSAGEESIKANQQLAARLKSTGDASKLTGEQLGEMAEKQASATATTKTYQTGIETLLLTFTNIKGAVYEKALPAVNDIAAAMHESGQSAAVQLGKALNNPVQGLTALQRIGITFNDTQKKQISTWVAHGETAKAQGLIISEVEKKMGGAAEASVTPAEKFHAALENLEEEVGEKLYPVMEKLTSFIASKVLPAATALFDGAFGSPNQKKLQGFAGELQSVGESVQGTVVKAFNTAKTAIGGFIAGLQGKNATGDLATGFQQFGQIVKPIISFLGSNKAVLADVAKGILAIWVAVKLADATNAAVQKVKDIGTAFKTLGSNVRGIGSNIGSVMSGMKTAVTGSATAMKSGLDTLYLKFLYLKGGVASSASTAASWVKTTGTNGAKAARDFAVDLAGNVKQLALQTKSLILSGVETTALKVKQIAVAVATKAWTAAQWLFNAAMDANPIALLIIGIAALVGAIVVIATKTTWFQTAWKATWGLVKAVAADVWGWIQANWKTLVEGMVVIFTGGIGLIPVLFVRYWGDIKGAAAAAWAWLKGAFSAFVSWFSNTWKTELTFWTNLWNSGWNAIKKVGTEIWGDIQHAFSQFTSWVSNLWNKELTGWKNIAHTMWHDIQSGVDTFKNGFIQSFTDIKNGVGKTWDGLKKIVAAPINFVISTVYDSGIRTVWNATAGKVGLGTLPNIQPIKLREGGIVPGGQGGGDRIPAMLEPGERVLSNDQVRKAGGHRMLDHAFGKSRGQIRDGVAYASGGWGWNPVSDIVHAAKDVGGAAKAAGKWGLDKIHQLGLDAIYDIAKPILNAFKGTIDSAVPKTPEWQHLPAAAADKFVAAALSKLQAAQSSAEDSGSANGSADPGAVLKYAVKISQGKPYVLGGVGPDSFDCSGLVQTAYNHFGVSLPRTSQNMIGAATKESLKDALPGDLVFEKFDGTFKYPGHVAFFAGPPDKIYQAANPAAGIGYGRITPSEFIEFARVTRKNGLVGSNGSASEWKSTVDAALEDAGLPMSLEGQVLKQIMSESGGNPNAVNNTDYNAQHGYPSKGLLQVIQPTFDQYAGQLKPKGIFFPEANIYAAIEYAKSEYGPTLMRGGMGLGSGSAYAEGGWVNEPVVGVGIHSGAPYSFAENGPEYVVGSGSPVVNTSPGGNRKIANLTIIQQLDGDVLDQRTYGIVNNEMNQLAMQIESGAGAAG